MKNLFKIIFVFAVCLIVHSLTSDYVVGGAVLGMALTAQIPQAWKLQLEPLFNRQTVFEEALSNRNYEGEMKTNGTLNIVSTGDITIGDYDGTPWADSAWEDMSTTSQAFTLDQVKDFKFVVDDVTATHTFFDLVKRGSANALVRISETIDTYLSTFHSSITTNVYGTGATPIIVGLDTSTDVLPSAALARLFRLMTDSNADMNNVNVVVPTWFADGLLKEFGVGRATVGGDQVSKLGIKQGKLDFTAGGFAGIYVSTAVPNTAGAAYKIMAGTPASSITFAKAIDKVETGRLQNGFKDFVKGLYFYGAKVPFEKHMGLGTFTPGSTLA